MIDIEHSLVIERSIEDVFAYHEKPENVPKMDPDVVEYKQTSEGPVDVGATYLEVREFMGRRVESIVEITEYMPNRKFGFKSTSGPIQLELIVAFEAVEEGTRVNVVGEIKLGGILRLLEPLLSGRMQRLIEGNYANLKCLLEEQAVVSQ